MNIKFYNNSILNIYLNQNFIKTWWEIYDQYNKPVIYYVEEDEIKKSLENIKLNNTLLKIYYCNDKYLIKIIEKDNIKDLILEDLNDMKLSLKRNDL